MLSRLSITLLNSKRTSLQQIRPPCRHAPGVFGLRFMLVACIAPLALLCPQGCTSARLNQFKNFAAAGIAYVDAADAVLNEAGDLVVDEDSDNLIMTRDHLSEAQRTSTIQKFNDQDQRYLKILYDIRRHNRLLRDYFVALAELAGREARSQIGKSTKSLYDSLSKLHQAIGKAQIKDGKAIGTLMEPAVTLAVAQFQQAALEEELRERAQLIERELALQHAAMKAVARVMKSRLESTLTADESTKIVLPYAGKGTPPVDKLPRTWKADRRRILKARVSSDSVDAVEKVARRLQSNFVKLVNNEFDLDDLHLMIQDMNDVIALMEMLQDDTS